MCVCVCVFTSNLPSLGTTNFSVPLSRILDPLPACYNFYIFTNNYQLPVHKIIRMIRSWGYGTCVEFGLKISKNIFL